MGFHLVREAEAPVGVWGLPAAWQIQMVGMQTGRALWIERTQQGDGMMGKFGL